MAEASVLRGQGILRCVTVLPSESTPLWKDLKSTKVEEGVGLILRPSVTVRAVQREVLLQDGMGRAGREAM